MKVVMIGSGSTGNCAYIETHNTKILIDAGLSMLQIRNRLKTQGVILDKIDGVLVTHEHSDHISDLVSVLTKTSATLYIEEGTFYNSETKLKTSLKCYPHHFIKNKTIFHIGDLSILPLKLSHDTPNCFGYIVKEDGTTNTYGQLTDTGYLDQEYYNILSKVHTLVLESNHDVVMQKTSNRTWFLINRVLSDKGHLSNDQCVEALKAFISDDNKHIILGHISKDCNEYDLAYNNVMKAFDNNPPFKLDVALRDEALPMMIIGEESC